MSLQGLFVSFRVDWRKGNLMSDFDTVVEVSYFYDLLETYLSQGFLSYVKDCLRLFR